MMITEQQYKKATGYFPEQDDLERCSCKEAGQPGHFFCGWCGLHDLPRFWCGCSFINMEVK